MKANRPNAVSPLKTMSETESTYTLLASAIYICSSVVLLSSANDKKNMNNISGGKLLSTFTQVNL